jgi:hypothetical protein
MAAAVTPSGTQDAWPRRVGGIVPSLFGALAEAAWIAIFVAAAAAMVGGSGAVSALALCAAAALVGLVAAWLLPNGPIRAPALLAVALATVVVAFWVGRDWLAPSAAPPLLACLLLGLAALRGAAEADPSAQPGRIEGLVRVSPLLLGAGWLTAFLLTGPARDGFLSEALICTLVFVIAATLALGMTRLTSLAAEHGQLGGRGPWLLLIGGLLASVLVVTLVLSGVVHGPLDTLARLVWQIVAVVVITPLAAVLGVLVAIVDALAGLVAGLIGTSGVPPAPAPPLENPQPPVVAAPSEPESSLLDTFVGIGIVVTLVLLAWYLARRWQGAHRAATTPGMGAEHRAFKVERLELLPGFHLPRRRRSWSSPDGALTAYPRVLQDWAGSPEVARMPDETPAAHAARLRATGTGSIDLELLAADYQLARFGEIQLPPSEERRAVRRWHRLRRPPTRG